MCQKAEKSNLLSIEVMEHVRNNYQQRLSEYRKEIALFETLIDLFDERIAKCKSMKTINYVTKN